MRWRSLGILVAVAATSWCLLSGRPPAHAANVPVKMSWTIGKYKLGETEYNITYRDAHIEVCTAGNILDFTPASIKLGGFSNSSSTPTLGDPDDCITVDWTLNPGEDSLSGEHTVGFEFTYDNLGGKIPKDHRVVTANVTGVSIPDLGIHNLNQLPVAGPNGFRDERAHSANFWLKNDSVGLPATDISNLAFYRSPVEPSVGDLTAAGLVSLGAIFLQSEPDFSLPNESEHFVHVLGVDAGDWLIARYRSTRVDPTVSAIAGQPVSLIVDTYLATQVVPEPSTLVLAVSALVFAVFAGGRRQRQRSIAPTGQRRTTLRRRLQAT